MYSFDGPSLHSNRKAFAFEALGLPEGLDVRIAEMRFGWKVLRTVKGVPGEWSGEFSSPEEALASVQ
jgi:hypothetical protein